MRAPAAGFSKVDHSQSPPRVTFPRDYNAAIDLVDRHVLEGRGDRVAVRDDRGPTTYAQLSARVGRAGNLLRRLGVQMEQRVMMLMLDTVDFPAVFFGAMKIGAVPVPVNTLLTAEDYAYLLADSRARVLCVSDALYPKVAAVLGGLPHLAAVVVVDSPLGGEDGGHPHLGALLEGEADECAAAPTTAEDVGLWLYSSGSTGRPKGAVHLHSHPVQTAALFGQGCLGIRPDDVVYSAAKLFFAYGLGNAMTFPLSVGATAVLRAERPTAASVMKTLGDEQPTLFFAVPTLFAAILGNEALAKRELPDRLRFSVSAGEMLPRPVGERWKARFGTDIIDGIGSTEMLHMFLSNRPGDIRYGTTGKPVAGYQARVLGDDGEPALDGVEGSLWVSGPSACVAYWNQRERSLATFHGPWTRTGDRYSRDADGYYTYCGRADDMLKVGGIWVSPVEVEAALAEHEAVREAAVVGKADDDGMVKPAAFVVLHRRPPSPEEEARLADELKAFVKARLAPFKYPRWVTFRDELPRTATGKLQRFRLG